jgi:hypothetical protein
VRVFNCPPIQEISSSILRALVAVAVVNSRLDSIVVPVGKREMEDDNRTADAS